MKHLFLSAVSAAALLLAAPVLAQNVTTITQTGSNNSASSDQSNGSNELTTINQISSSNIATVAQGGVGDQASILQDTDGTYTGSTATVTQVGLGGIIEVLQHGYNNATVTQGANSVSETAYVSQTGYNPNSGATLQQNGNGESGWILQTGNFNISTVTQSGVGGSPGTVFETAMPGILNASDFPAQEGGAGSEQVGFYNTAVIDQEGVAGIAATEATGTGNYQNIIQGAGTLQATAFILTTGDYNVGEVTQAGGAGGYAGSTTFGTGNFISVFQNGASLSLIGQGTHIDDFGIGFDEGTPVSGASATVVQTGDGNTSFIEQFANAEATVTQISNGEAPNDSEIHQDIGSDYSMATVNQSGALGFSYVEQSGEGDIASVTQEAGSSNEGSSIVQSGASNTASVDQAGASEASNVAQTGSNNSAYVVQFGFGNQSNIIQTGDWNSADVTQKGVSAQSTITQTGSGNSAIVKQ
ncbi:MAG TPA: hypothetical protein VGL66_09985 [Caulobacteraceae bacterium]|jgi:hypothetical protein